MKNRLRIALGAGVLALALGGFSAVVIGGAYDVAATEPHLEPVEAVLRATMESSVRRQARDVEVPEGIDLQDRAYAARFFGHYDAACRTCHGAPGRDADPWMVLYPPAPELTDPAVVDRWTDEELFWILKHGIKDTGMMALGPTHGDEDVWGVTAFVRQLPRMTAEYYASLAAAHAATRNPRER